MNTDLVSYYSDRAAEYEDVYLRAEEQGDLAAAEEFFQRQLVGKTVLEVACGTGYWTQRIARVAGAVFATDINESMISIAAEKTMPANVKLSVADMYELRIDGRFYAVFAGFIWSHILLQDLDKFLSTVASHVAPGGKLVLIDGKAVEGTTHDLANITQTDSFGNTFQTRTLRNGTKHLVLKNFPTNEYLREHISRVASDIKIIDLDHYWIATASVR